jgi:hypothetical protein
MLRQTDGAQDVSILTLRRDAVIYLSQHLEKCGYAESLNTQHQRLTTGHYCKWL